MRPSQTSPGANPSPNPDPAAIASPEEIAAATAAGRARHLQVVRRVRRSQLALTVAGLAAWFFLGGIPAVASFAVGAAASLASFGLLDRLTSAVGGHTVSKAMIGASLLRILLVGGALFAILQIYSLHPLAIATGLMITVGAILVEALLGNLF